jgi:electron transfer flavoprotein alpha subunit
VANIVVFAEIRRGEPTAASRFAVSEARRMASELGATVYAVMTVGPASEAVIENHAQLMGRAGADRILCCADVALEGALLDATVGPFLTALVQRLQPALTLFPAGAIGPALGPPLAIRLGGVYHPRACLEVARDEAGLRLSLRRFRASDGAVRTVSVADPGRRPVVATLPSGPEPGERGQAVVEVEMLPFVAPPDGRRTIRQLGSEPDDAGEAVELASTLLSVGAEVKAAELEGLRAAAPPGTVVVREGDRPPGLELACPARLLVAGKGTVPGLVRRTIAPGTRVAVAGGKSAEKDLGRIDVIWRPAKEGLSSLVAALNQGAAEETGR